MTNPIGDRRTRLSDHFALAGVWLAVIAATVIYGETCRLANGTGGINLRHSGLWTVEIWTGWLVMSFLVWEGCRQWRRSSQSVRLWNALALMVTLSVLALVCEWWVNALLAQLAGVERWESVWAMFNRRALLCAIVSAVIVLSAARPSIIRRDLGTVEPLKPNAEQDVSNSANLVLMGRDGPITVSPREIEAILAAENYVQICLVNGKEYLHRTTLAKVEHELSSGSMLRVHRSAIVNVNEVRGKLPGGRLQLTSGRIIRIGRSFREAIEKSFERSAT